MSDVLAGIARAAGDCPPRTRWPATTSCARRAAIFPPGPLIALKHGISFEPGRGPVPRSERLWGRLQEANARLSPEGRVVVAAKSHHRIAEDEPEVVVGAIREVVEAARAG